MLGTSFKTGYVTTSPRLDFNVEFVTSGTVYVWLRGYVVNTRSDSVHVGLDGVSVNTVYGWNPKGAWIWTHFGTTMTVSAGAHSFNVWAREDGFILDKIVLTTDPAYRPSGMGPAQSARTGGGGNAAPVAGNDPGQSTPQDTPVLLNVLTNDSDSDGSLMVTSVVITTPPTNGSAVPNADGTVTYTPNSGYTGSDSFRYTVNDDQGATSNTALVSITVTGTGGGGGISFTEVTGPIGITHSGQSYGASWGDLNGDGWPDLWTGNHHKEPPSLYENQAGTGFIDLVAQGTVFRNADRHGAQWADFDNDGDQDLLVTVGGNKGTGTDTVRLANELYVNNNAILNDQSTTWGIDYPLGRGRTPFWFDGNNDGQLDVFFANTRRNNVPSILFMRSGASFINAGFPNPFSATARNMFAQLSMSNLMVIDPVLVVHSKGAYPSNILSFSASGYKNVATKFGFPGKRGVWDVAIGDFDNDLINDFFLVRLVFRGHKPVTDQLLIQTVSGMQDVSASAGFGVPTSCESVSAADLDNDMDLDLYLVCQGTNTNLPNMLYENQGNGTFILVAGAGGAEGSTVGMGESVAAADYDRDGFIDLLVTNGNSGNRGPTQLFRNLGNANHWLEIDLQGTISNRDGIGARVLVSAGNKTQLREQSGGMHRYSQDHQRIHFGLGANTVVNEITVYWPSGTVQQLINIPADQIISVIEPN